MEDDTVGRASSEGGVTLFAKVEDGEMLRRLEIVDRNFLTSFISIQMFSHLIFSEVIIIGIESNRMKNFNWVDNSRLLSKTALLMNTLYWLLSFLKDLILKLIGDV